MAITSLGEALDSALALSAPPAFGLFARVIKTELDRGRLIWVAAELWLALDQGDRLTLSDAALRAEVSESGMSMMQRLDLDLLLLDEKERRMVLVAFWRGLTEADRAAFLNAVAPENGRGRR